MSDPIIPSIKNVISLSSGMAAFEKPSTSVHPQNSISAPQIATTALGNLCSIPQQVTGAAIGSLAAVATVIVFKCLQKDPDEGLSLGMRYGGFSAYVLAAVILLPLTAISYMLAKYGKEANPWAEANLLMNAIAEKTKPATPLQLATNIAADTAASEDTAASIAKSVKRFEGLSSEKIHKRMNLTNHITLTAESREALDVVESSGLKTISSWKDTVATIKDQTHFPSVSFTAEMPKKHANLISGQMETYHGSTAIGERSVSVASVVRASKQPAGSFKSNKVIEDRAVVLEQSYQTRYGTKVKTTLALSCDGENGAQTAHFFSESFSVVLQEKLNAKLANADLNGESVSSAMYDAYKETQAIYLDKGIRGSCSLNAVFLYTTLDGVVHGVCINKGTCRAIAIDANGVPARLHKVGIDDTYGDMFSMSTFDVNPGDSVLLSSRGLWESASPTDVAEYIHTRRIEIATNDPQISSAEIDNKVLAEIVLASSNNHSAVDYNPILLHLHPTG